DDAPARSAIPVPRACRGERRGEKPTPRRRRKDANRPATFVIDRGGVIRFGYRAGQTPGRVFDREGLVEGAHWSYDRPSVSQLLRVLDGLPGTPAMDQARKDKVSRLARGTVAALAAELRDEDSYVRAEAAKRLAERGAGAREAVPALTKAL